MLTRRAFLQGASVLTLGAAMLANLPFDLQLAGDALAQGAPAAAPTPEDVAKPGPLGDQAQGDANAPVTIVEYASMTCTHCATFHNTVYPTLKTRYIDTGKVRYILREFPLDPLAAGGFMLARCAGEGKYFTVVDALFKQQPKWAFVQNPIPPLFAIAKEVGGFTEQSFEKCLSDQKLLDGIDETRSGGQKLGVNSTPTFFINGKMFRGTMTVEELDKQIAPLLKS
ncbi:MAG TPA: DsbA family protein [Xanthobacteraceae bacterium]